MLLPSCVKWCETTFRSYVADVIATMADRIAMFATFRLDVMAYVCLGGRCYNHSFSVAVVAITSATGQ